MFVRIALLVAVCWALLLAMQASAAAPPKHVRCFSDVTFEKTEGDYVGYVVLLMQHRNGMTIVFQEASGALERPILAEAKLENGNITFELPTSALTPGLWKARLRGTKLMILNPAGQSFALKSICR